MRFVISLLVITLSLTGRVALAASTVCNSVAACVMATNSSSGSGFAGTSKTGSGISGISTSSAGLAGSSSSGFGLSGISKTGHGVNGTSASSFGVVGSTSNSATSTQTARDGVLGQDATSNPKNTYNSGTAGTSTYGTGILGISANGTGVLGTSTYGAGGTFTSVHTDGVVAQSLQCCGPGVYGSAYYGPGLYGVGNTGVSGDGDFYGVAGNGGVYGGYFTTTGGVALELSASSSGGVLVEGGNAFSFDNKGNETLKGTLTQKGTPMLRTHSALGADVASFGARSASPTIEDFGTGVLRNGVANVSLERTFASTIDSHSYLVFITPHGDSNGLYTSATPTGFTVHENKNGRSSLAFDYRVVAKPLDTEAAHLPVMGNQKFTHARAFPVTPALPAGLLRRSPSH